MHQLPEKLRIGLAVRKHFSAALAVPQGEVRREHGVAPEDRFAALRRLVDGLRERLRQDVEFRFVERYGFGQIAFRLRHRQHGVELAHAFADEVAVRSRQEPVKLDDRVGRYGSALAALAHQDDVVQAIDHVGLQFANADVADVRRDIALQQRPVRLDRVR